MSNLAYREDTILPAGSGDGNPEFGASYQVVAYEVGAQVVSATGTAVTVRAGHGFAANDYAMLISDTTSFVKITVAAATELTTGTTDISAKLSAGDLLVNLGPDGASSGTPDYDGSPLSIYSDMAGAGSAISDAKVTCNAQGVYGYWHSIPEIWELTLDSAGDPVDLTPDVPSSSVIGPASSVDNAIARFNGTSGKVLQDYTSDAPTISDDGDMTVGGALTLDETLGVAGKTSLAGHITFSTDTAVTAGVGGTYGNAVAVSASLVHVTSVASANDSIRLPVAQTGRLCAVINDGGNAMDIFATTGDTIGDGTAGQAYSLADGSMVIFFSATATIWYGIAAVYADGAA